MIHVTEADVKRLLRFAKAIELVREAYVRLARGEAANPLRVLLSVPGGASMFFMPGHVYGQGSVAVKVARVNAGNPRVSLPTVLLTIYAYDATTGVQVAEVEGEWLTAARMAASTAVATDVLASKSVRVLECLEQEWKQRRTFLCLCWSGTLTGPSSTPGTGANGSCLQRRCLGTLGSRL